MPRILIIEDRETIRNSLQELLENRGYEIDIAINKKDALEMFREDPVDIVITGTLGSIREGINTISELLLDSPGVKIIATYDENIPGTLSYSHIIRRLGVWAIFCHPIDENALISSISSAMQDNKQKI